MKKVVSFFFGLVLLLCFSIAQAVEIGGTVTITLEIVDNSQNATSARIGVVFDEDIFEFVSAKNTHPNVITRDPSSKDENFGLLNLNGLPTGKVGSIVFRVKENAKPGTYSITAKTSAVFDANRNSVVLQVQGEDVIVECPHTPGTAVCENEVPATCKDTGSYDEVVYCSVCDTEISRTAKNIDKLTTHNPGAVVRENEVPATCKDAGSYDEVVYCSVCGTEISRTAKVVDKLTTHTPGTAVRENEIPATCKDAGSYDEVVYCSVCGTEISRTAKVVDKLTTHTPGTAVRENEIPATCKDAGSYDEVVYCSVCGTEISRIAKEIDKLATHTPGTAVRENEIPATCKDAGSCDEVVYCSVCRTEISRTAKNIDKLATHTDENKDFICDICGENLCTQHTPGNAVRENEVAATCKDAGSYEEVVYCSNCGTEISRTVKSIDKLTTHTPGTAVREKEVPATCKEAGSYDEVVYCSTCGTEISRTAKVIDKLTTHTDANSDYTCDVCGTNLCVQHIPDTAVHENEVPATCKDAGSYDEVVYCITCHTEISRAAKVIDKPTTHTSDAAVRENEVPATCKDAGSYDEVVYCSVCGEELSRAAKVIDKLTTHTPAAPQRENEIPETCKDEGSYDEVIYCSVCGTEISRTAKTIDKLDTHTDDDTDEICDVCGADLSVPVVSKVTVIGGSGSGNYTEGDTVSISADTADTTKVFKGWSGLEGLTLTLGNATTSYLSFIMPDHDVTISAEFEMVETYTVSFNSNGGTGSMEAIANILGEYTLPECKFVAPAGKQFKGWALAVDGEIITDTYAVVSDVTLYAIWEEAPILPEVTIPTAEMLVDVNEGETGTMSITATNATAYQWYINRNDGLGYVKIAGATTSTYTTSTVNLTNDGYTYYCVASNVTGSAQSPAFTLNVIAKVVIPETGDNANLAMWFALMLVSCVGLFLLKRNGYRQIS